jgi:hypothetical protein
VQVGPGRRRAFSWSGPALVVGFAVAAITFAARSNWAQNGLDVQLHSFQDTRGVTVLSPTASFDRDFTDRTGLKVKFGVDAISAASDSCARCHQEGARNQRTYVDFSLRRKIGDWKMNVGGEVSQEKFYASESGMISVSRDLNKGNTTIAGGYSFSYNRPKLHPSSNVEQQFENDLSASITQTLTKTTIVQVSYDLNRANGYLANPFLRTQVNGIMQVGTVPDLRTRQAITVRLRQALPANTYLEADYRRYFDSWSLQSNAFSVGLSHYFTPSLLFGFTYRHYDQTGAFFYEPFYTGSPEFFTGDFRLSPFNSGLYTGRVVITPRNGILGMPAGTSIDAQYERYQATTGFQAATFSFGFHVPIGKK